MLFNIWQTLNVFCFVFVCLAENEKCEDEVTEMYVPFVRGHYSNKNAGQIIIEEFWTEITFLNNSVWVDDILDSPISIPDSNTFFYISGSSWFLSSEKRFLKDKLIRIEISEVKLPSINISYDLKVIKLFFFIYNINHFKHSKH